MAMHSDQPGLTDKAQVDGQPHSNRLRAGLKVRVDCVIASIEKGGHSETEWKILTREVDVLSDMLNCMLNEILETLEHNSRDLTQVEDWDPDNWIGNLSHKLWLLKRDQMQQNKAVFGPQRVVGRQKKQ